MASHAHDTVPHAAVVYMLDTAGVLKLEPNIACLEAIYSPNTGIVSYRAVALRLAELILQSASTKSVHRAIRTGFDVRSFERIAQQSSQAQGASITGIADNGLIRLSSASGEVVGAGLLRGRGEQGRRLRAEVCAVASLGERHQRAAHSVDWGC